MAHFLEKPTLDKDLDKLSLQEAASNHVLRGSVGIGFGLIMLIWPW